MNREQNRDSENGAESHGTVVLSVFTDIFIIYRKIWTACCEFMTVIPHVLLTVNFILVAACA